MCDVCKVYGRDWRFENGSRSDPSVYYLHRVYRGGVAHLTLCYIHSIDLFRMGEMRFLEVYKKLLRELVDNKRLYSLRF